MKDPDNTLGQDLGRSEKFYRDKQLEAQIYQNHIDAGLLALKERVRNFCGDTMNTPDTEQPDIVLTKEQYDIIKEHASSEGFVTPDTEDRRCSYCKENKYTSCTVCEDAVEGSTTTPDTEKGCCKGCKTATNKFEWDKGNVYCSNRDCICHTPDTALEERLAQEPPFCSECAYDTDVRTFIEDLLTSQKEQMKRVVEGIKEKYSRRELQEGGYSQACDDILQALDNLK